MLYITLNGGYRATDLSPSLSLSLSLAMCVAAGILVHAYQIGQF